MEDSAAPVGPHAPGVLEQSVDDDLIVFNPTDESYYTLNRTAREVWELADGSRTVDGVVAHLAAEYGAEPADLHDDVAGIIAGLRETGLI